MTATTVRPTRPVTSPETVPVIELTDVTKLPTRDLARWLRKARVRQWDYKNIVKRRGVLVKLGEW